VAKPELGSKRLCASCAAKFYDLNKTPITCPKCGTLFGVVPETPRARFDKRAAAREPEVEAEEVEEAELISLEEADAEAPATASTATSRARGRTSAEVDSVGQAESHRDHRRHQWSSGRPMLPMTPMPSRSPVFTERPAATQRHRRALNLPAYCRWRSSEALGDLPDRPAHRNATGNLFAFLKPECCGGSSARRRSDPAMEYRNPLNAGRFAASLWSDESCGLSWQICKKPRRGPSGFDACPVRVT
jgi:uncharacterized protein (TIGR02300 family)